MDIIKARNPTWSNKEHSMIDLIVRFSTFKEEVPYTANPNDTEEIGKELFKRALAKEFGTIAEYVPPKPPTKDFVANVVRTVRNNKLQTEVDPVVSNPLRWNDMTEQQQNDWKNYRLALLAITDNKDFPWYDKVITEGIDAVPWPKKPI